MLKILTFFILSISLAFSAVNTNVYAEVANDELAKVYISEVNYAGSSSSKKCNQDAAGKNLCNIDKWVEIYNYGSKEVDLTGWNIVVKTLGNRDNRYKIENKKIRPDEYIVFGNNGQNSFGEILKSPLPTPSLHIGQMNYLSNYASNAAPNFYVGLENGSNIVSSRSLTNIKSFEASNSIVQSLNEKHSIQWSGPEDNTAGYSTEIYYSEENEYKNYGTPGKGIIFQLNKQKEGIANPAVVEVPNKSISVDISLNTQKITDNSKNLESIVNPAKSQSIPQNIQVPIVKASPANLSVTASQTSIESKSKLINQAVKTPALPSSLATAPTSEATPVNLVTSQKPALMSKIRFYIPNKTKSISSAAYINHANISLFKQTSMLIATSMLSFLAFRLMLDKLFQIKSSLHDYLNNLCYKILKMQEI